MMQKNGVLLYIRTETQTKFFKNNEEKMSIISRRVLDKFTHLNYQRLIIIRINHMQDKYILRNNMQNNK